MSTNSEINLAISIARCEALAAAINNQSHPCHKVVSYQKNSDDRHIPEPWFGNLSGARVLFISSNPSIDESDGEDGENYPRANWSDEKIGQWFTRRVDQTWDEVPVTFRNSRHKDFNWRCKDGEYRGVGSSNAPQNTWNNLHKVAQQILGEKADPSLNYALTEIVHCKSPRAIGVPEASQACSQRWLPALIEEARNAECVVFLGANVRPWVKENFAKSISKDFGRAVTTGGSHVAKQDSFVAEWSNSDGSTRQIVFCFLPHPTSSAKGGRTFETRYGSLATQVLGQIVDGSLPMPRNTSDLHSQFS